ncbi:hypothetical protein MPER_06417, partial [Moniliophthora perniciosa FA553]
MNTRGRGLVKIRVKDIRYPDKSFIVTLEDAHYAPECPINLFSFGSFLEAGMRMYYEGNEGRVYMKKPSPQSLVGESSFAAFPILPEDFLIAAPAFPIRSKDRTLAHDILGHPGESILDQVLSGKCGKGFETYIKARAPQPCKCDACIEGKFPQLPYASPGTVPLSRLN